jgi:sugar lactone lactonase YvrE
MSRKQQTTQLDTTQKIADDQYYIIQNGAPFAKDGQPVIFTEVQANRHMEWQARKIAQGPVKTQKVKGVVDNRHRNWRRRG